MYSRTLLVLSAVALAGAALAPRLNADEWNKKTTITITEPVRLPTTVLEPGTYVFKLLDSSSDRHIVQVFKEDGTHIIATILAIPNYRLQPTGKSVFGFWETPAGQPRAMRAWFYPGDNFGQEFAYPKTQSMEIAKVVNAPVLAITLDRLPENVAELQTVPVIKIDEKGNEMEVTKETVVTKEGPVVATVETPQVQPVMEPSADRQIPAPQTDTPKPASLPQTASSFPLIGLLGLLSLATFGLMSYRSRRA